MADWLSFSLWIVQALLCALFLFAGFTKLSKTPQQMAGMGWAWAEALPLPFTRFVGALEVLGAAGVVLPLLTHVVPVLTPFAAAGFVLLQLSAIVLHARRGEAAKTLWFNLILLGGSLFVLWGLWATV